MKEAAAAALQVSQWNLKKVKIILASKTVQLQLNIMKTSNCYKTEYFSLPQS